LGLRKAEAKSEVNPTWRGVPSARSEARGRAEAGVDDALDLGDVELQAVEEELRGGGGGRPGRPRGGEGEGRGRWGDGGMGMWTSGKVALPPSLTMYLPEDFMKSENWGH